MADGNFTISLEIRFRWNIYIQMKLEEDSGQSFGMLTPQPWPQTPYGAYDPGAWRIATWPTLKFINISRGRVKIADKL